MGRFNRVVAVDVPHHVTQRGNARRFVLGDDADRTVYLKLLRENIALYGVALIGYCLMSNHVHLGVIGGRHTYFPIKQRCAAALHFGDNGILNRFSLAFQLAPGLRR